MHNEIAPSDGLEDWSYAAKLSKDSYVEIDLLVPEFVEDDPASKKQSWFPLLKTDVDNKSVVVVKRGPRSYAILLKRGVASAKTR